MDVWHKETTPGTTGSRCTIRDGSGLFVAECIASDAPMIVAAPAMLAALEAACDQLEQCERMFRDDAEFTAALEGAQAAITLATGGTPTGETEAGEG